MASSSCRDQSTFCCLIKSVLYFLSSQTWRLDGGKGVSKNPGLKCSRLLSKNLHLNVKSTSAAVSGCLVVFDAAGRLCFVFHIRARCRKRAQKQEADSITSCFFTRTALRVESLTCNYKTGVYTHTHTCTHMHTPAVCSHRPSFNFLQRVV